MKSRSNFRKLQFIATFVLLALALNSCNFPGMTDSAEVDQDEVGTQVAQTLAAQTSPTLAQPVNTQPAPPTATLAQLPAATATLPVVPSLTSSASTAVGTLPPSPPPGVPVIRADVDTNCRMGPSKLYQIIGYLLVGQESPIHGRNSDNTWWYIETPKKPGSFCWAWGGSTRVEGDTSHLPIITPPPPPTLTPTSQDIISVSASYSNVHLCGAIPTAIFKVSNTGNQTIESISLTITNLNNNTVVYLQSSNAPFMSGSNQCPPGGSSLAPGSSAFVGGAVGALPGGTSMRTNMQLCSEENLSGSCLVYTFDWTMPNP